MSIDGKRVGDAYESVYGGYIFEAGDNDDWFCEELRVDSINEAKPLIEKAYLEFCESRGRELLGVSQELARRARALKGER